jgi:hypothetical protein
MAQKIARDRGSRHQPDSIGGGVELGAGRESGIRVAAAARADAYLQPQGLAVEGSAAEIERDGEDAISHANVSHLDCGAHLCPAGLGVPEGEGEVVNAVCRGTAIS